MPLCIYAAAPSFAVFVRGFSRALLPELFRVLRPDRDDIVLAGDGQLETLLELNTRPLSPPGLPVCLASAFPEHFRT